MLHLNIRGAAVQNNPDTTLVTATGPIANHTHGGRAKCLQRLVRLDLPVPRTVAVSFDAVQKIAKGEMPDVASVVAEMPKGALMCVRPSSQDPDWGGPGAVLNIGINDTRFEELCGSIGEESAAALYTRFVQGYAINVARLDPDMFDEVSGDGRAALTQSLRAYEAETEEQFPQDPEVQLAAVLRSMARAWDGTSARLLRQAKGAPADAGLGLVVQEMAFGVGTGQCGSGVLQLVDSDTGLRQITGRYLSQSQGRDALASDAGSLYLTRDPRGPSLEELAPEAFQELTEHAALMRRKLRAEMQVEFVIQDGKLHILDGVVVARSSRAAVKIAVALADEGIIPREEALMRVEPRTLTELLHRQIDPRFKRDEIGRGIAASPGAATGKIVFSASEAQASAARGEACILIRRETSPEDIRGMHAAAGVLTERGGVTSHAAVIGRGLGLPCVVGVSDIKFNLRKKQMTTQDGRVFGEGDEITLDGSSGTILAGQAQMIEAALDENFTRLMGWAEDVADIGVRANADTPADAQTARNFNAHGIGLCRTEHMFFEAGRLTVMREMIFAETGKDRRAVLERLLPMQRDDFKELFRIMQGQSVCIRLFDPPLHEFLPMHKAGQRELADALNLPLSDVTRRIEAMSEYNPMLGLRGVRLGVTVPEIYEMQARAIFEATVEVSRGGEPVVPEIMIPLVSARREVELVKTAIDAVAAAVRTEQDSSFEYRLGIMVETPRAALMAGEIAPHCAFLSFGTNDLTQMTYGLSRDDAGRFMSDYVQQEVFDEDPFHMLDTQGVGELLKLGAERGRAAQPGITISLCGEHGGNPESIAFCRDAGFDYVSCSPFRVPVARLAAAQLAIKHKIG
ncbi:pyruvate, phosphate dikinase [Sulfitobacter sp. M57]|uniref:putative PEP-binding protein n=1 Tax=unclassified Sulfitobacter TaxID=196795 RepID=UPI0023E17D0C|nr:MULTISPECIES: putative PEP-binding protein [unclassified Sulfitobacter]MDF3414167.1 pyruvate, phosphate dikinase [Sulfitobacter sp. KE5]MDF3420552.1 pyruvate, phosphate dikinase [Sulfitobacter sp. KE43]MDF3432713.1 pyruvate, phosphate dikinase [Sulfitobacter sp. KE42]MDF3458352.1 pyruvate, phosphate dikinase [Sulfitobacter sp. S74]MDF3462253.1 pyruvate, phosphate dikinase [Sulfitobacter sp. Ks18]